MSYVTPRKYRETVEAIASDYASLKAEYTSLYTTTSALTKTIVELTDDNSDGLSHDVSVDPPGSIASDLGKTYSDYGQKFIIAQAKKLAANQFRDVVTKLNTHVINRTSSSVSKIGDYYDTYAIGGSYEMSLFSADGVTPETSYYFSSDFVELATELGFVTSIDTEYRA